MDCSHVCVHCPCAPHPAFSCACVVDFVDTCAHMCSFHASSFVHEAQMPFLCAHSFVPPGFAFSNQSALTPKRTHPLIIQNFHSCLLPFIPVGDSKGSSRGPFDSEYADSDMLEILRDISLFICARGMDRHGSEHGSFTSPSFLWLTTSIFTTWTNVITHLICILFALF